MPSSTTWPALFQALKARKEANDHTSQEARQCARQWEQLLKDMGSDTELSDTYNRYYKSTKHEKDDTLIDQQEWYDELQELQLFVQKIRKADPESELYTP